MSIVSDIIRRDMVRQINENPKTLDEIRALDPDAVDTDGLQANYEPISFSAPILVVRRRADAKMGTLLFQHHPRVYFGFKPHEE